MNYSQKIYFNDKPLILTTSREEVIKGYPGSGVFSVLHGADEKNFTSAVEFLECIDIPGVVIEDASSSALVDCLHRMYHSIDAGGGVTYNEEGAILMIYRRGRWDLPKGKLDEGEDIASCALREVSEETGLQQLTLREKICDTYHIYTLKNERILKRTAWYKMQGSSTDTLAPQEEENIMEARWVHEDELGPLMSRTYEAIREVLHLSGLRW